MKNSPLELEESALLQRRTFLLFTMIYVGLILAIGLITHAWTRGPSYDEVNFYLPALEYFSKRWPHILLRDYPFPTPPLLITAQSWFFGATGGSLAATRLLSNLGAIATAAYLIHSAVRKGGSRTAVLGLAVACFPIFLWLSFTVKHYSFINGLILIGLDQWRVADQNQSIRSRIWSGVLLACAAASSQFTIPICSGLIASVTIDWWRRKGTSPFPWLSILAAMVPLLIIAAFFCLWGAAQPAAWTRLPESNNATYRIDLRQAILGLGLIGFWITPISASTMQLVRPALILWIPSAVAVWWSRLYAPGSEWMETPIGPLSNILVHIARHSHWIAAIIAGGMVASGLAFLFWAREMRGRGSLLAWIVFLHITMMTVSVPSLYESYYTTLILPMLWLVGMNYQDSAPTRLGTTWLVLICFAGIAGSIVQLQKPPVTARDWVSDVNK